jgi:hypothetical protein
MAGARVGASVTAIAGAASMGDSVGGTEVSVGSTFTVAVTSSVKAGCAGEAGVELFSAFKPNTIAAMANAATNTSATRLPSPKRGLLAYSGAGFFIEPAFLIGVLIVSVATLAVLAAAGLAVVLAALAVVAGLACFVVGFAAGVVALFCDAGLAGAVLAGAGLAAGALALGCASACWIDLGGFTSLNDAPHISHSQASAGFDEPQAGQRLRDLDVFVMTSCAGVLQCMTGQARALPPPARFVASVLLPHFRCNPICFEIQHF